MLMLRCNYGSKKHNIALKRRREYLSHERLASIMRKKTKEDEHQSSLDSFASADVPTMPDLDNLTKADKIIRQEKNESINDDALNTFAMPSMANEPVKTEISANMMFHNLETKYPNPPITDLSNGLVLHRAVLHDLTGTSQLLDWLSEGHAAIVEMGRLIKREIEFTTAIKELHTFVEGDMGGQIIQITDTRIMLLPPGCRGLKGVEMEAFAAGAEDLGRRRI